MKKLILTTMLIGTTVFASATNTVSNQDLLNKIDNLEKKMIELFKSNSLNKTVSTTKADKITNKLYLDSNTPLEEINKYIQNSRIDKKLLKNKSLIVSNEKNKQNIFFDKSFDNFEEFKIKIEFTGYHNNAENNITILSDKNQVSLYVTDYITSNERHPVYEISNTIKKNNNRLSSKYHKIDKFEITKLKNKPAFVVFNGKEIRNIKDSKHSWNLKNVSISGVVIKSISIKKL